MDRLADAKVLPLQGGETSLSREGMSLLAPHVPEWNIVEIDGEARLQRTFTFSNFAEALAFTNRIGQVAEAVDHHPSILTEWGRVTVTWWTHKVRGLHRNDFIMAARTDQVYSEVANSG
jgi:4a-hydroxytetrahydrobiopterin dehydratase